MVKDMSAFEKYSIGLKLANPLKTNAVPEARRGRYSWR